MTNQDLPVLRQLALNGKIIYTKHGTAQMLARGYKTDDVENILSSMTNQLVETQSCSSTPGKEHKDPRFIISDPSFCPDTNIVIAIDYANGPSPDIVVITVEEADDNVWDKDRALNPWLKRK